MEYGYAQIDKNMRGVMLNPDIYGVIFQAEGDVNSYVTSLARGQQWEIKKSDGKFSVSGLLAAERDIMYSHQRNRLDPWPRCLNGYPSGGYC
jgi:hypothetical protein